MKIWKFRIYLWKTLLENLLSNNYFVTNLNMLQIQTGRHKISFFYARGLKLGHFDIIDMLFSAILQVTAHTGAHNFMKSRYTWCVLGTVLGSAQKVLWDCARDNIFHEGYTSCTLVSRGYFFLIDTDGWRRSRVNEEKNNLWLQEYATSFPCEKSVQNLNWVTDWILSHVKLFDVANQGHHYIVNSLRTWEYPIGDPVQILNWFLTWKWGCVLLWPEVIFFLLNAAKPPTISIDKKKISSGTQGTLPVENGF